MFPPLKTHIFTSVGPILTAITIVVFNILIYNVFIILYKLCDSCESAILYLIYWRNGYGTDGHQNNPCEF